MAQSFVLADSWRSLRTHTAARIALGRAGGSLPTREVIDFSLAHAAARDAVHARLDVEILRQDLMPLGLKTIALNTQAGDRQTYLQRPDLGRKLDPACPASLREIADDDCDISIIIGDGLSAPAAQTQTKPVLERLIPMLQRDNRRLSPISIVRQARVAVEDEIGAILRAKLALILLGERPGLGTAQSLGAYLVYGPQVSRTDAQRNCVSNIRPDGLPPAAAAETLHYLISLSLNRQISGVLLKDERALSGQKTGTQLPSTS